MFKDIIKSIIELSGGSVDKVNLGDFMEQINHSFMLNPENYWLGVRIQKNPLDLMVLQEIMFDKKPDTIIECGTLCGGSAYYMAGLMDLMNIAGKIVTIDCDAHPTPVLLDVTDKDGRTVTMDCDVYQTPTHPKIEYIRSNCLTADIPTCGARTMLILDCDHSSEHVYAELEKFSGLVSAGQYIIVEDTDAPDKSNGPADAVQRFLNKNRNFAVDKSREKFGVSSNLGGYLLRIS